jgi:DNA-directed RNA polymerase specialized sigma24 family protein
MNEDAQLLGQFARTGDEAAFRELVERYFALVYSAALRQVNGDAHLAEDVAQSVFTDLARKAGSLSRRVVLAGWVYEAARFAASPCRAAPRAPRKGGLCHARSRCRIQPRVGGTLPGP